MPTSAVASLQHLEREARQAAREGREADALRLWSRVLEEAPDYGPALSALGIGALRRGDPGRARVLLERAAAAAPGEVIGWINLAMACKAAGDLAGEAAAVERALICDPMDLIALVMKARNLEHRGQTRAAAAVHAAVLKVAPPPERLSPDLRAAVEQSRAAVQADRRRLDDVIAAAIGLPADQRPRRFNEAVEILLGRQKRYTPEPVQFYYPGLAPIYFFDRREHPWLQALEAATDEIREEFLRVQAQDRGFEPYVAYPPGTPVNQWAELNHSDRWNAFHLLKNGAPVEENASRCPVTISLLRQAPQPVSPGRSPNAMFSLLAPRTRIPPHSGVVNTRLVVHIPLIVPDGCGFRVGSEIRPWRLGEGVIFDDTIEHEAWNESDDLRVVLIFDVWRPELDEAERALIADLMKAVDAHEGRAAGWEL
jgi:aspartate beta-hydroxylase